ncbi:pre-mRNA-splicing factor prp46 putative [Entamoeba histolytica]|uniref:Pre-mRNA-splicing factor PRP46, putative n=4 Tax=Entamoeba histolytica TaxID=5759 RepID=C4LSE4_ENTH1|nr:pre-mRNA-splicing factor PRP46, putative [Entamoeba histolytica HM-1:IMSS]EAL50980.2 pre-mRNA-splicing factor PRP46, putative [Entamoeba histolytica HM-1:IMSS]GAT91610.1 pre-mRNA-splicing factor prp46 putative [Entamoeba histolytica]|eukprot:XP_656363.2 pre-mRNA-splicing factor PRP46, putative [Entamoeba histolytica HM-1:IMSS]
MLVKKESNEQKTTDVIQWKLKRVICSHKGWVSSICFDPSNQWFCTGSHDETIKIFGMIRGEQRLTLTGHIGAVKSLKVSPRHPYLFSAGDDKTIKCWDLESNKVVKHFHGHLSGIEVVDLHPTIDVIGSGGRDSVVRLWDIRTKQSVDVLEGHTSTIYDLKMREESPHLISSSADSTIKMWDIIAGKCMKTLTQHTKGVRCVEVWDKENMVSASFDSIKLWDKGEFVENLYKPNDIINTIKRNQDGTIISSSNNGVITVFNLNTITQTLHNIPQPGSLEGEKGILCSTFDQTGLRFFTGCVDKTIKMYAPQ